MNINKCIIKLHFSEMVVVWIAIVFRVGGVGGFNPFTKENALFERGCRHKDGEQEIALC